MSPIIPFLCEHIWQTIIKKADPNASCLVLTADFPTPIPHKSKTKNIIASVKSVQEVISLALSLRARENLKLRQPLNTLFIRAKDAASVSLFESIIRDEVNVKRIEIVDNDEKFNTPYLSVNFKTAGAILKGEVQKLKETLAALDEKAMQEAVASYKKGKVTVGTFEKLPSSAFTLGFKNRTEFVSVTHGDITLVLDTVLTEELIEEGILRELIRSIQVARQNAGLEISKRVALTLACKDAKIQSIISRNKNKICDEVLASSLEQTDKQAKKNAIDLEGHSVEIKFE